MSQRFELVYTEEADQNLEDLEENRALEKRLRSVRKTLGLMEINLRHPSLRTHEYTALKGLKGEKVFESYAENNTPAAYRIFWHYGPGKGRITVLAITPHP